MDAESFGTRYDTLLKAPRMRALYGDSGYFNIGYWEAGATDLVDACDRLVDELASIVPDDARFILDVGCGHRRRHEAADRSLPRRARARRQHLALAACPGEAARALRWR